MKQKRNYRTRDGAKATDPFPEKIPNISIRNWVDAISFRKNKYAYMYQKDDNKKLPEIQSIRYLYGAFMLKYPIDLETEDPEQMPEECEDCTITFYVPDYFDPMVEKKNIGSDSIKAIVNKISGYVDLIGVVREEELGSIVYKEYPVIKDFVYDEKDHTITLSSPYIMAIIRKVESARIRRDRKGVPIRYKDGKLALSAAYSYRLYPSILRERNHKAVELVGIIATLIDRAGSPNKNEGSEPADDSKVKAANIRFRELINRSEMLKRKYESIQETSKKDDELRSVFNKTWELLLKCTDVKSCYKNIKLPDPKDKDYKKYIPSSTRLDEVIRFPHDGKVKRKNS